MARIEVESRNNYKMRPRGYSRKLKLGNTKLDTGNGLEVESLEEVEDNRGLEQHKKENARKRSLRFYYYFSDNSTLKVWLSLS